MLYGCFNDISWILTYLDWMFLKGSLTKMESTQLLWDFRLISWRHIHKICWMQHLFEWEQITILVPFFAQGCLAPIGMIWNDWLRVPRQFKETNLFTLPETDIVPEHGPSQKETHLPTISIFRCYVSFRDKNSFKSYLMVQAMSDTSFEFFDVGIFTVAVQFFKKAYVLFWMNN